MKRISDARLKSMEADGATVHRLAPERQESDLAAAMLAMSQQNAEVWQQTIAGLSTAIASISENLKPETVYKDVPVEVPTPIDYDFAVNRDDDGLISTIDLMDGARKAGVATFKRDKDYRVTSITTRSV